MEWSTPEMEIGNGAISDGAGSPVCLPAPPPPLASTLPPPTRSVWSSPGHWPLRTPGLGSRKCPLGYLGLDACHSFSTGPHPISTLAPRDRVWRWRYPECTISPQHLQARGRGAVSTCRHRRGQHTASQGLSHHLWGSASACFPPSPGPHLGLKTGHKASGLHFPPYSCFSNDEKNT